LAQLDLLGQPVTELPEDSPASVAVDQIGNIILENYLI